MGCGTRARVVLPAARKRQCERPKEASAPGLEGAVSGLSILIVADEPAVVRALRRVDNPCLEKPIAKEALYPLLLDAAELRFITSTPPA